MIEELPKWTIALAILVGFLILSWLVVFILDRLNRRYFRRTTTTLDDIAFGVVRTPLRIVIVVAGIQLAIRQADFLSRKLQNGLDDFFFVIYLVVIYLALMRLITGIAQWYVDEIASKTETDLDDKFLSFFRALANTILTVIVIIVFLGRFGIEPSALVTTLGIGTLAVALAAQETLSDIISGFIIMIDQPFAVGDRVEILDIDTWGDVIEVGLRSTRVLTRDNRLVAIPNSVIGKGLVVNYSDPSTVYRVQTHIGIPYGSDIEQARRVMIEAIQAEGWVMKERPIEALMLEFGSESLVFRVRCWIENYIEKRRVIDKMNTALYEALGQTGINVEPVTLIHLYRTSITAESGNGKPRGEER
jgi:small-conductance mechanosensitive channel